MGYEKYLLNLLMPLGVYSFKQGTHSGAEVKALGTELDVAENWLAHCEREAILATAENEGLTLRAELFGSKPEGSPEILREILTALGRIADDSFTLEAMNRGVAGFGAVISETGGGGLTVSFPKTAGKPAGFAINKRIIEDILPSHMAVSFYFNYLIWGKLTEYGLTWAQVSGMTWVEFMKYRVEELL